MELTASQLAELVKGTVEGDRNVIINNFAKIEEASKGCLTFLANPKYTHFIYSTKASAVLVRNDFTPEQPVEATLIRVADPYATLADLLNFVNSRMAAEKSGIEQPSFVSDGVSLPADIYLGAFAYIGKGVTIGKHVKIYPQVYVGDGVTIGDNVILYPGVKIYHGCRIGNGCILHAGVVIGGDGFGFAPTPDGYEKIAQIGNVVIDDNVEIGANTTIDRATMGSTHIHRGVKLDNLIQVAHNVEIGEHTVIAAQTGIAGSTKLGSHNMIGGQVGFAGHITVGNHNQIGAQTGIPNNVGDNKMLMGYPAVPVRDFARQAVWVKNLGSLFADVAHIKKKMQQ
ncbi:MAG: UDP-3-O-(3-hydroxymyristoyl)glucosamine N-acyltransferase [Muribaculaceae bacterium]